MLPGGNINPRQMKQMMKKLGMQVEQIEDVKRLVIETGKGNYVFDSAEVTAMTMQGVTTYQVLGEPRFEEPALQIPEDDVKMVAEQTGKSPDAAREVLLATKGDIAEAIMRLTQ
jgi:nascent polypeptide-associated complex subunit alpha